MSLFDFEKIHNTTPDQADVLQAIETWLFDHPDVRVIPRVDLIRDLFGVVRLHALQSTLDALIKQGVVRERFRVVDPESRTLLPESYDDRDEIPDKVVNTSTRWIAVRDENVATVLESPALSRSASGI